MKCIFLNYRLFDIAFPLPELIFHIYLHTCKRMFNTALQEVIVIAVRWVLSAWQKWRATLHCVFLWLEPYYYYLLNE